MKGSRCCDCLACPSEPRWDHSADYPEQGESCGTIGIETQSLAKAEIYRPALQPLWVVRTSSRLPATLRDVQNLFPIFEPARGNSRSAQVKLVVARDWRALIPVGSTENNGH